MLAAGVSSRYVERVGLSGGAARTVEEESAQMLAVTFAPDAKVLKYGKRATGPPPLSHAFPELSANGGLFTSGLIFNPGY
jgi:hypothetical protein